MPFYCSCMFPNMYRYFLSDKCILILKSIAVFPSVILLAPCLVLMSLPLYYCCVVVRFSYRNVSLLFYMTVWYSSKIHVLNECHKLYIFSQHQMFFGLLDLLICRRLNSLSLYCSLFFILKHIFQLWAVLLKKQVGHVYNIKMWGKITIY